MIKLPVKIRVTPKNAPGQIRLERRVHKGAVMLSGGLTIITKDAELNTVIVNRLKDAANQIRACGGTVGSIKTSTAISTIEMISVTESEAMIKRLPEHRMRMNLAATAFKIDPINAEKIIENALEDIKRSSHLPENLK